MKMKLIALPVLATLAFCLPVSAANQKAHEDHGHTHEKKEAGPNGGRLLLAIDPHAEFYVTPERKVQITFLDKDDKPVPVSKQVVIATGGDRSAPTKLIFAKVGNVLLSDVALPAGNDFPMVVQITTAPGAKIVTEKFNVNLSKCSECKHAEYACTCDH